MSFKLQCSHASIHCVVSMRALAHSHDLYVATRLLQALNVAMSKFIDDCEDHLTTAPHDLPWSRLLHNHQSMHNFSLILS